MLERARPSVWWRPASPLGRARLTLLAILSVLTVGAWAFTLHHMRSMTTMDMPEHGAMNGPGWSIAEAAGFVAVWTVMMAAMMLPAAAPMIVIFAAAQARRSRGGAAPTWSSRRGTCSSGWRLESSPMWSSRSGMAA